MFKTPNTVDQIEAISRKASPQLTEAGREHAVAGIHLHSSEPPEALGKVRDQISRKVVADTVRKGTAIDAARASFLAATPEPAGASCDRAIENYRSACDERLAGFEQTLAVLQDSVLRADRQLRAFLAAMGRPFEPTSQPAWLLWLAVLLAVGLLEAGLGANLMADLAPSPAHSWRIGLATAAAIIGSGLAFGFVGGRYLRCPGYRAKAFAVAAFLLHMAIVAATALGTIAVRFEAVELGDLEAGLTAAPAALVQAFANGDFSVFFEDLRAVYLFGVSVLFAGPLAFAEGMGKSLPGEFAARKAATSTVDARDDGIIVAREDLDEFAEAACEVIGDSVADHAAQAARANEIEADALSAERALSHAIAAGREGLVRATAVWTEARDETLGPLTAAPPVSCPILDLTVEENAARHRVKLASAAARAAENDSRQAVAIAAEACGRLQAEIRGTNMRFDAILQRRIPSPPDAGPRQPIPLLPAPRQTTT